MSDLPMPQPPLNAGVALSPERASTTACAQSRNQYYLAPLVFPCLTRQGAVFLDLNRNRYLGIGSSEVRILVRNVQGLQWKPMQHDEAPEEADSERRLLTDLVERGILLTSNCPPSDVKSDAISLDGDLACIGDGDAIAAEPSASLSQWAVFLSSLAFSAAQLHLLPLRAVVRSVHSRRTAVISKGYQFDVQVAAELVRIFRSIRPYFFLAKDHCLLHALTLVNFLSHYGHYPAWVFGVSSDPWMAHSWVQHGSLLLDSTPETVCSLDVILAV